MYIYNHKKRLTIFYIIYLKFLEVILGLFKTKKRKFPEKIKKILIVKTDHIGDTIISTICFEALKENYKEVKIDVVCGSWGKNTYIGNEYINKVFIIDHFFLNRNNCSKLKKIKIFFKKYIKLIFELKKIEYDLCFFLRAPIKGNLGTIVSFINSSYNVGFIGMGLDKLLDKCVMYNFDIHEKENFLNLLRSIPNFELQNKEYSYKVPFIKDEVLENYCEKNMQKFKEKILINYEGGDIKRILIKEKVIEIIKKVSNNTNKIYLMTTQNNKDKNFQILDQLKKIGMNNIEVLPQVDNIFKLGYFLKKIDKVITVDTAITHLASVYVDDITVLYYNDFGYINNPKRFYPNCKRYKNIVSKTENINEIKFII